MLRTGRTDWLAVVLYPLAVILMQSFWVYPWLNWLGSWPMYAQQRPALSLGSVIVVLVISLAVTRFLNRRDDWSLAVVRSVIIGLGIVVFIVVLRLEYSPVEGTGWFEHAGQMLSVSFESPSTILVAMPVLVFLWWRGIVLGRTTSYFKDIYSSFIIGMVALILLIIIWWISGSSERFSELGSDVGWNVIAFFFFGLLAIAVCHLYNMRRSMPKEEAALTSVWRWLPIMLGVVGGMVLAGLGIASIFSPEFFATVGKAAGAVGNILHKAIEIIAIPLNYVMEAIMWVMRFFLNLIRPEVPEPLSGNMTGGFPEFGEVTTRELPLALTEAIKWVVVIVLVAAIIFFLARAIGRFRNRRRPDEYEEIHESLFSWAGLKDDLKAMLDNMKNRFTIKRPHRYRRLFADDLSGTLDVREIYRRVLWEASRSGLPRQPHETTEEYARRIGRLVPDSIESLDGITDAYAGVRYGEISLREEQVSGANHLWQTLRGVLRTLRGEQPPDMNREKGR
ncbi:MAG: DUF4129 domain-containing protein [Dehalococcoidales bacterium]|nr:DUF4129 domain-containing protein [Dehalococcoidales bacterium]